MKVNFSSTIAGIGAYLPSQIVYSDDLMGDIKSRRFGTPESYIRRKIGIVERRISTQNERPSDLAIHASRQAIDDAGIAASDIDLIIFCAIDKDWCEPATAHRVQSVLGIKKASVFDVTNACHGFMNGMAIANSFIAAGSVQNALVCTGEQPTRILAETVKQLKSTDCKQKFRSMFGALTVGDAGGAMILQSNTKAAEQGHMLFDSRGEHAELCYYRHTSNGIEGQMMMQKISQVMLDMHRDLTGKTRRHSGWMASDIDVMHCHQVGAQPHKALAHIAGVDIARAPITYNLYGNLTSATIPVSMALHRPMPDDKVLLMGAGSGLSICQAAIQM